MLKTEIDPHYQVALPEFEGPLDLMLHLVRRHEIDIFNIPISFVTEKYLEYLDLMRSLNVDVASEYLLMAATLAHIKSRELLPRQDDPAEEEADDGEDPKEALIRRLLEYQRYKEAAAHLGDRPALGRQVFPSGAPPLKIDRSEAPLAEVGSFELLSALNEVLQRRRVDLSYQVTIDRISISDRINDLVDILDRQQTLRFVDCFSSAGSSQQQRHELVVTFLAILEMARLNMIRILQELAGGEIYVTRAAGQRFPKADLEPAPDGSDPTPPEGEA